MTSKIVSVRFTPMGKAYHFDAGRLAEVRKGDYVVVETARGWQLGQVVNIPEDPSAAESNLKQIDRVATVEDLEKRNRWQEREREAVEQAKQRGAELHLRGVKIINAEFSFDGKRLSLTFCTEGEDKADLKSLRPDLQKAFAPAQVELRQIGPRDVARVYKGIGACGREERCCSTFLTEFNSISIRMAKEQGISLTPSEITGICGRLRCCLNYEYEQYCAMRQDLPRKNKRVMTPSGEGKVLDVGVLRQRVVVDLPDIGRREFDKDEITVLADDAPYTPRPAGALPPRQFPPGRQDRGPARPRPIDQPKGSSPEKPAAGQATAGTPGTAADRPKPGRPGGKPNNGRRFFRRDRKKPDTSHG